MTKTVVIQNWEESERGWGTRPDGFTIHVDMDQHKKYVDWYYKTFNNGDEAPHEYTRVCGDPIEVEISDELYDRIQKATQSPRRDKKPLEAVHGKGRFFSTSPRRALKEKDVDWPDTKGKKT